MTVKDFLRRINEKDYDKVILFSDGVGWTNISGKVDISESSITIFSDNNAIFSDDKQ